MVYVPTSVGTTDEKAESGSSSSFYINAASALPSETVETTGVISSP